jgi:hypothetical protein
LLSDILCNENCANFVGKEKFCPSPKNKYILEYNLNQRSLRII